MVTIDVFNAVVVFFAFAHPLQQTQLELTEMSSASVTTNLPLVM